MALSLQNILDALAADKATWIDIKDPAQFTDGVARRAWSVPLDSADELAQWLRFHTDAGNVTTTTTGTPPVTTTTAVVTFKVSTPGARLSTGKLHALAGDWRGAEVGIEYGPQNPQEQGKNIVVKLTQTLKEGFLTSITTTSGSPAVTVMNFAEVRVVNVRKRLWASGKYDPQRPELAFFWPNIDATKLKACTDSVAATLSSPVIDSETYAGTWYRKNYDGCREEDGTGVVWAVYSTEPDSVTLATAATAAETATRTMTRKDNRADAVTVLTNAVTPTTGKSFTGTIQRTEEGYVAEISADTAVLLDSGWVTRPDVYGTARRRMAKNVPATGDAPIVSVASIKASLNPAQTIVGGIVYPLNINFFAEPSTKYPGLFEVTASEEPGKPFVETPEQPWRNYQAPDSGYVEELHSGGKHYYRTVTKSVKNCGDETTAWAFLNATVTGTKIKGSGVVDHGYSRFTATRLTVDDSGDNLGWTEYTI